MICRTNLFRQATQLSSSSRQPIAAVLTSSSSSTITPRAGAAFFTTSTSKHNAAPTAPLEAAKAADVPDLTPLTTGSIETTSETGNLSSCVAGTVLNGLNYTKGKTDPVALEDSEYPSWLWDCLSVQKKVASAADAEAGDEFSKSKKQRRLAIRRQRAEEAKMLQSGNLEALAPKVPLGKQSINLAGGSSEEGGGGGLKEAVFAAEKREELRKALRKDRKAKIKESNFLKTM
ncbi:mitochondrial ribosomal protein L37-domain-containing protein [Podospora didyma]|uniref:Large ribosomal subunit protein mL54 n=1 Tax=Podospora didyma TaxID=330526 RepID=A0AAE0U800_9PEZI|nr:mitochondrial ribosomal protein L37-domain-containing protein [Podospora didyma]